MDIVYLIDTVRDAGRIARTGFFAPDKKTQTKSNSNDKVTFFDKKINEQLMEKLQAKFPDIPIISEELTPNFDSIDEAFIIDPIDGTNNFDRGYPIFAVSLAYVQEGKATAAACYNPITDELFVGQKGKGAGLNGDPLYTKKRPLQNAKIEALICYKAREHELHLFPTLRKAAYMCHNSGSNVYSICKVAQGSSDVFLSAHASVWDYAPYILLEETGHVVTNWHGQPFDLAKDPFILAARKDLHEQMLTFTQNEIRPYR